MTSSRDASQTTTRQDIASILNRAFRPTANTSEWRESLFASVLVVTAVADIPSLIHSMGTAVSGEGVSWFLVAQHAVTMLSLLFVALWDRGSTPSRFGLGLFCTYALAISELLVSGPAGTGPLLLTMMTILAAIHLDIKACLWALLIDGCTLVGLSMASSTGPLLWHPGTGNYPLGLALTNTTIIAALAVTTSILVHTIESALNRERTQNSKLLLSIQKTKQTQENLNRRLALDTAVIAISQRLSHSTAESLEQDVQWTLQMVGETMGLQRAQLFWPGVEPNTLSISHEWCSPDAEKHFEFLQCIPTEWVNWPSYSASIETSAVIYEPTDLDTDALLLKRLLEQGNTGSTAVIGLMYHGQCSGLMVLDAEFGAAHWNTEDLSMTQTVASLISTRWHQTSAEQAVRESELRYRRLVENAPLSIVMLDENGRVISSNTGPGDLPSPINLGRNTHLFDSPEWRGSDLDEDFETCLSSGQRQIGELSYVADDGECVWLSYHLALVADGPNSPRQVLMIAEDISETRQLHEHLDETVRMEALGQLAGGVAHDFNNLLTVINGYSEILLMDTSSDAIHADIEAIHEAGQRAATLTRQLLTFSRRQSTEFVSVNVNKVLEGMAKMLRRLVPEDIELTLEAGGDIGTIHADIGQIEQVVMNLVVNARDAMPQGGRIHISTSTTHLDASHVARHPQARPGKHVCIQVRDTGCGIPEEVIERIFEPFFTTKRKSEGTGLGLATVYAIVSASEGHVTVESSSAGSTFKVFVPEMFGESANTRSEKSTRRSISSQISGEIILVIEDDDSVRRFVTQTLAELGYEVIEAASGDAGISALSALAEPVDLVLTDVVMPGINGTDLLMALRRIQPDVPTLLMSGYPDGIIDGHGHLTANEPLLRKPVTRKDLAEKVRLVLDESIAVRRDS